MSEQNVENIYARNKGSATFFKRPYYDSLIYTEGIKDFQETLNAYWLVDTIISHLPQVIETYKNTEDGFFVVTIQINKNSSGTIEIFREGYEKKHYNEHITVTKQFIPYIDLPIYNYKFYLILSSIEPIAFTLLLTGEY